MIVERGAMFSLQEVGVVLTVMACRIRVDVCLVIEKTNTKVDLTLLLTIVSHDLCGAVADILSAATAMSGGVAIQLVDKFIET